MTSRKPEQPSTDIQRSPLPPEVTEHPGWQLIWDRLLSPTPDEIAAVAAGHVAADDPERGVA